MPTPPLLAARFGRRVHNGEFTTADDVEADEREILEMRTGTVAETTALWRKAGGWLPGSSRRPGSRGKTRGVRSARIGPGRGLALAISPAGFR